MYRVGVDGGGKIRANGTLGSFLWVGGAHQVAVFGYGALTFQHLNYHGTGGHELDQRRKEGALAVFGVDAHAEAMLKIYEGVLPSGS